MNTTAQDTRIRSAYETHFKVWTTSIALTPLCLYFALHRGDYTLLDNADLIIHEAGHVFFAPLGPFLRVAGGTLMQLILPGILIWHFMRHDYRTGAQVSLFWLGQNLINISVYAADARARVLPLLGGNRVGHDWANMLGKLGLLPYDQVFGDVVFSLALLIFSIALILPRYSAD